MKKNKNFKGFTLIEVLVALAVLAIMALMLSMMYVAASKASLTSNSMNKQVDFQSSLAMNGGGTGATSTTATIRFCNDNSVFSGDAAYNATYNFQVVEVQKIPDISNGDSPNIKYSQVLLP